MSFFRKKKKVIDGQELLRDYRAKSKSKKSLSTSRDSKALKRIFEAYDEKHVGRLEGDLAVRYVTDLLEVSGLQEQIWEDALCYENPNEYYNDYIQSLIASISDDKGYIELSDLEAVKNDKSLQEFVSDVSERLEQQRAVDAFHDVISADVKEIKAAYKRSKFIKADEIKFIKKENKIRIPTRSLQKNAPAVTLNILVPEDPDEKMDASLSGDKSGISSADLDKLLESVRVAAKSSHSSIHSCVVAFVNAYSAILTVDVDDLPSLSDSQQSWKTRTVINIVQKREDSLLSLDCHEATLLYGPRTVVWLPSMSTVRIRLNLAVLPANLREDLGLKAYNPDDIHAVISVRFNDDYLESNLLPIASSVSVTDAVSEADAAQMSAELSDVLVVLANQFISERWPTLSSPEDWVVNKLMIEDQANTEETYSYCDAFEAAVATHYNIDEARIFIKDVERRKALKDAGMGTVIPTNIHANSPLMKILQAQARKGSGQRQWTFDDCLRNGWLQKATAKALALQRLKSERALELLIEKGAPIDPDRIQELQKRKTRGPRNFVLELVTVLVTLLDNLSGSCLICGSSIGPNPIACDLCICTKGRCQFAHIEMQMFEKVPLQMLPVGVAEDIRNDASLVDLLITMCYAAAYSHRADQIFNPFPPMYFKNKQKDLPGLQQTLRLCPSVADMEKHATSEAELRKYLDGKDPSGRLYDLILWTLSVQRPPMLRIPKDKRIKEMTTEHQYFLMAGTDVERRKIFREAAKKYGTYFAWHGSSIENWHAIFRVGLLNMSGSDLQTAGAAYGPGVYMAADSGTSFGYARFGNAWPLSRFNSGGLGGYNQGLQCISIAEVAKAPGVPTVPNPYYVVQQDQYVMPRFFFIYNQQQHFNVMAADLKLTKYTNPKEKVKPGEEETEDEKDKKPNPYEFI